MVEMQYYAERICNATRMAEKGEVLQQKLQNFDIMGIAYYWRLGMTGIVEQIGGYMIVWIVVVIAMLLYGLVFNFTDHKFEKVKHYWGLFIVVNLAIIFAIFGLAPFIILI